MSWSDFLKPAPIDVDAKEIASIIPHNVADILLGGEAAIERADFKVRDEIITAGLARRAWPKETASGMWQTWMTPLGCEVRDTLAMRRT